jgi:cold shock CspA family protein
LTIRQPTRLDGTVVEYDDHAGLGWIEAGSSRYLVHCTRIADGSRHLAVGQQVTFRLAPGHDGRWEAAEVA